MIEIFKSIFGIVLIVTFFTVIGTSAIIITKYTCHWLLPYLKPHFLRGEYADIICEWSLKITFWMIIVNILSGLFMIELRKNKRIIMESNINEK